MSQATKICPVVSDLLWPIVTNIIDSDYPQLNVPLSSNLQIDTINVEPCCVQLIEQSFIRFKNRILTKGYHKSYQPTEQSSASTFAPELSRIVVSIKKNNRDSSLKNVCIKDSLNPKLLSDIKIVDESYSLQIIIDENDSIVELTSSHPVGILRGLVTLSQLVQWNPRTQKYILITCGRAMNIIDGPRFKWRGLMVDTSRHYYSIKKLQRILNGMELLKLNVFHWHIVDAQSFPYQSATYPYLAIHGSYEYPKATYDKYGIQYIIKYGASRGIRIIPEFDMPAHTASWGKGYPKLTINCSNLIDEMSGENSIPMIEHGIDSIGLNPLSKFTYLFVKNLLNDVKQSFNDIYLHIGGDEINKKCWETNVDIKHWIETNGNSHATNLQAYFVNKILPFLLDDSTNNKRIPIGWDEMLYLGDPHLHGNSNGQDRVKLPKGTVIQWWRGWVHDVIQRSKERQFFVVQSYPYYLDHLNEKWNQLYRAPLMYGKENDNEVLIGGEACMWSEHIDASTIESTIFSKLPAVAERLWSPELQTKKAGEKSNIGSTARRLNYLLCLLKQRDRLQVGSAYPDYCSDVKVADHTFEHTAISTNKQNYLSKLEKLLLDNDKGTWGRFHRRRLLTYQQDYMINSSSGNAGGHVVSYFASISFFMVFLWILFTSVRSKK